MTRPRIPASPAAAGTRQRESRNDGRLIYDCLDRAVRLFTDANARTNLPERPNVDQYMMGIAEAVKARANCQGSRIGALLVLEGRIVSTGYNGTPSDMTNCDEGGCERCANPEQYPSGTGYDVCICVHAEQNALLAAARFGIAVEGAILYSTMRPCFGCTKELLQARVKGVVYLEDWRHPDRELRSEYEKLQARFPDGVKPLSAEQA